MAIQQENVRFTLKSVIAAAAKSLASLWKPALVAAPLLGTALFFAAGTHAQTSSNTAPPATEATTVAPIDAPAAARRGRGPKEKTKELVGRAAGPSTTTDTATTAQATGPVAPIDTPDAARTGRPKERDKEATGRVASPPATTEPVAQPTERRREGPKGDGDHGRTETPAPDSTPAEGRREGPKGAVGHGRTEAPAPDTQPTGRRREGPKGAGGSGRTATTPLIIGALSAAAVLALVVSSGNDRPASP